MNLVTTEELQEVLHERVTAFSIEASQASLTLCQDYYVAMYMQLRQASPHASCQSPTSVTVSQIEAVNLLDEENKEKYVDDSDDDLDELRTGRQTEEIMFCFWRQ